MCFFYLGLYGFGYFQPSIQKLFRENTAASQGPFTDQMELVLGLIGTLEVAAQLMVVPINADSIDKWSTMMNLRFIAKLLQRQSALSLGAIGLAATVATLAASQVWAGDKSLNEKLAAALQQAGFTGRIESTLETRLGRPLDPKLANLGRLLFFDKIHSLHQDNTCAGCHSPTNGFGDTQSIAIGIQNNNLVGPNRKGPRNQRRTPLMANIVFYPALMWNGRFSSNSGNPFDNSEGFHFPPPEDDVFAPPHDPVFKVLNQPMSELPPTELTEVAGYTGTCGTIQPASFFCQFDDGKGLTVPPADASGSHNYPIRDKATAILNATPAYRQLFGEVFPTVASGGPIDFTMFGRAIAEFEFFNVFANAPLDRFARGDRDAMTAAEKRGALVFFGKGNCVGCHAVAGDSNEMFSDFKNHVVGVPQIAPFLGKGKGNVIFDGPGQDEDFGLEQISNPDDPNDRYKFRTAPLRNLAVAPAYFHNGAFTRLEDAIRLHLDANKYARIYDAKKAGVAADLTHRLGPIEPVLDRLDPLLQSPVELSKAEFHDLVDFVENGLHDPGVDRKNLCKLVPSTLPSGMRPLQFEQCHQ